MVEIAKRYFGSCAKLVDDQREIEVLPEELVTNILLFDHYILESCRLLEILQLVEIFGFEGVLDLLKSSALTINFGVSEVAIFQNSSKLSNNGSYHLFNFNLIKDESLIGSMNLALNQIYKPLRNLLSSEQVDKLYLTIFDKVDKDSEQPLKYDSPELKQFRELMQELKRNDPNVKKAITLELEKQHSKLIDSKDFNLHTEQIDDSSIKIETNLIKILNLSHHQVHEAIKYGILRLSAINNRLAMQEKYTALCDLHDEQLPIFTGKTEHIIRQMLPPDRQKLANQFNRIVTIKNFPDFRALIEEKRLDLSKILEIRETQEGQQFRDWLPRLVNEPDEKIQNEINNSMIRAGNFFGSNQGKTIRIVCSTIVGLIPIVGTLLGAGVSVFENFFANKLLPTSGPHAFVNKMLKSTIKPNLLAKGNKKKL